MLTVRQYPELLRKIREQQEEQDVKEENKPLQQSLPQQLPDDRNGHAPSSSSAAIMAH
jgi:hypothetical protein